MKRLYILSIICFSYVFSVSTDDREINKIVKLLDYTKEKNAYSGKKFEAGYQTHKLGDKVLVGQRDMSKRFEKIPYDFTNKTVLDIGTNQGGMLFAIADKIKYGIGIDYNSKLVNVANRLKSFSQVTNIDFYVFDLDKEQHSMINNFLRTEKVDICFFLSMCRWVNKWRNVIDYIYKVSDTLLFEANGSQELKVEEIEYLNKKYKKVVLLSNESDDDKVPNKTRALYICYKN
ncbi:MAG: class I SAM-dependent methyltransferase [Candidatus Babeliales bacterium]